MTKSGVIKCIRNNLRTRRYFKSATATFRGYGVKSVHGAE